MCNLLHWISQTVCSPGSHRYRLRWQWNRWTHSLRCCSSKWKKLCLEDVHACVSLRVVEALYVSEIKSRLSVHEIQSVHLFKGVIGCKTQFYLLFEHKCVLAVCVHNHPIMIKIHPVFFCFFLIYKNHYPFLKSSNDHSSRHLLPTSEPLKTQSFVSEGNAPPPPDLPKCAYLHANHLWSSFTSRRSECKVF